jgi:hypothetical protein
MVELKVNSLNWQDFGKDYYVSVRVGEVQKLSRMAGHRAYKFAKSAVGTRRYGKIEVFKRVGAGSVCLEGDGVGGEVTINCEAKPLKLDVQVSGGPGKEDSQVKGSEELNEKAKAAKEYLEDHHLELRLSEAMQAVLREKPEDPGAFIAKRLSENIGLIPVVKPREQAVAPPTEAAPVLRVESTAPLVPFTGYWKTYCSSAGIHPGLYSRFKKPDAAPAAAAPPKPVEVESAAPPIAQSKSLPNLSVPNQLKPSVGTWHSPRPGGRIAAHTAVEGQVVECGKTNKRGLVKSKTQTELLVECLETGKEEWKPIEDHEVHAKRMAHDVKEGETVGNVRSGKRGKVLQRTTTDVLISQGDGAEEWQTIEELEKVGEVPTALKDGEKARNFKSGVKGKVLTRTFTDVKLQLEDGREEWHGVEDLEKDETKMLMQSDFRVGTNFLTFGMRNMVHLI